MNLAHLHIVLNHVPVLGTLAGLGLYVAALFKRNDDLKKFSLLVFASMALLVIPTYLSGNAAQSIIEARDDVGDVPQALIHTHENVAIMALIAMTVSGTLAWFGLWQIRRTSRLGSANSMAILIFSIITAVFIMRASNLGGKISHPEVRYDEVVAESSEGWRMTVSDLVWNEAWVWPALETMHFLGMAVLFGVALLLNLRMMGMMKSIPFHALHRFMPMAILGFVVNVITGMIFFMASPGGYLISTAFLIKILLLVLAGYLVLYFTAFDEPWSVGVGKDAPFTVKAIAICTTILVLGVMYFGRVIPFL